MEQSSSLPVSTLSCQNCNTAVSHRYCPQCGQPVELKRIDAHYIHHEITHILHFENGILYTIKELLLRPGQNVRTFLTVNRSRLVKPIVFIIITSLIYTLISHFFHIEEGYVKIEDSKGLSTNAINDWVQNHYGYSNIIMGLFIAFWLKILFIKSPYNLFEILILLCFVLGMGMLMFSIAALAEGLIKLKLLSIFGVIYLVYASWAVGQFFNSKKISAYLKAFSAYILGMLTFSAIIYMLTLVADLLIKH